MPGTKKGKGRQDATLRNVRASQRRDDSAQARLADLTVRVTALERTLENLAAALRRMAAGL